MKKTKHEFKAMLAEIWQDYLDEFADWKGEESKRSGVASVVDFLKWTGEKKRNLDYE